jgi:hypothetical protein
MGDGLLLDNDVAILRQFIVGSLDPQFGTNEFQRADVAPVSTLGDGFLTAGDAIQARRYVAGLDIKTGGGGATEPSGGSLGMVGGAFGDSLQASDSRWLRVLGSTGSAGGQVTVAVEMMPMGNETASSFTLYFDPTLLSNPVVTAASGLPADTVLTVNTNAQANGRIMMLIDSSDILGSATNLKQLIKITFDISQAAPLGSTEISFGNWPTLSTISDPFGNLLASGFNSGLVTIAEPSTDVNGRVLTPSGLGLRNASVTMFDAMGIPRTVPTSSLGYFNFTDVPLGQTVTVFVHSRRYRFVSQSVHVINGLAEMEFIGVE